jgi:hypothetical protein
MNPAEVVEASISWAAVIVVGAEETAAPSR